MGALQQKNEIKSYNLRLEVRFLWGCLTTTEMVFDGKNARRNTNLKIV
jgi:hypothetical protein